MAHKNENRCSHCLQSAKDSLSQIQHKPDCTNVRPRKGKRMRKMYSIHDSKGEVYNQPFFMLTHGEAERSFRTLANDPKSSINDYPEDYDLYYLGDFDETTGQLAPLNSPQHVLKATAARKPLAII